VARDRLGSSGCDKRRLANPLIPHHTDVDCSGGRHLAAKWTPAGTAAAGGWVAWWQRHQCRASRPHADGHSMRVRVSPSHWVAGSPLASLQSGFELLASSGRAVTFATHRDTGARIAVLGGLRCAIGCRAALRPNLLHGLLRRLPPAASLDRLFVPTEPRSVQCCVLPAGWFPVWSLRRMSPWEHAPWLCRA
jgi:hypothetical protein